MEQKVFLMIISPEKTIKGAPMWMRSGSYMKNKHLYLPERKW